VSDPWKILVARYATKDKPVCNCRCAYMDFKPASDRVCMRDGEWIDSWSCSYGCSSAQIAAREYVAQQVLLEFDVHDRI
jgi:hypothetical protein